MQAVCVGGATKINISTEPNNDFEYTVFRRSTSANGLVADQVLGTFVGTAENNGIRSVSTGTLGTAGTETIYVTVRRLTNNTCGTLTIVNQPSVTVTNNPVQANAGADKTVCGTTAVLEGNDVTPGVGTWSLVSGPSAVTFSNPNNPTATAQGLKSGTYIFRWTVNTTCGGSATSTADEVTIKVNCSAVYTLTIPKYRDQYANREALATAQDPDGDITGALITQGTLPPGTTFNTTTGTISVSNEEILAEGTYPLTVSLTDALGGVTSTRMVLTIYGNEPLITPLPVELVYFTATVQGGSVSLYWLTASEDNNSHFEVERSADGETFVSLGRVEGNGTSSRSIKYSYGDDNPLAGTSYYRLKQVDFNGEFAYSKVVAVSAKGISPELQLQVYPNPFVSEINIKVTAQENGSAKLQLVDVQGRVVHTGKVELQSGLNEIAVPLQYLRNGLYILKLQGNGINGTVKVIKK
jgi:hypothetical protein